jgi:hypothetical protein
VLEAAALPVAVSAAFAAAPPLWFCIVCPAVLGLLTPLIINIALNQVMMRFRSHRLYLRLPNRAAHSCCQMHTVSLLLSS